MSLPSPEQGRRIAADHPTSTPTSTATTGTGPGSGSGGGSATTRPGGIEIGTGVAVFLVLSFGGIPLLKALGLDPVVYGLIVTAWSGIAGFAVASSLRIRSLTPFGVRRTSWRWLAIGTGLGILIAATS